MVILDSTLLSFSDSYEAARKNFIDASLAHRLNMAKYENLKRGPMGEYLACDTTWAGPSDAKRVLVMISATHGVEGFCGASMLDQGATPGAHPDMSSRFH